MTPPQDREAGDQSLDKFSGTAWVDWSHAATVGGGDARVARKMKNLRYDSVAIHGGELGHGAECLEGDAAAQ